MAKQLSADDLLSGGAATFSIPIPSSLLRPSPGGAESTGASSPESSGTNGHGFAGEVVLRPLLIRDLERVVRASKEQRILTSVLMVQQALVSPKLSVEQVGTLPAGLVQFLMERVNAISGLSMGEAELDAAVKAPLAKACFILAREFGWTPAECSELTVGQVLLYLEMLGRDDNASSKGTGTA